MGLFLEIQRSAISVDDIERRETFYAQNMVWQFDTREAVERESLEIRRKADKDTFRWKHPRKSIAFCRRGVYLDICDDKLFYVYRMYPGAPCGDVVRGFFECLQIL